VATDYYAVLGIERGASDAEIKRAYRGLARQYHPDVADDKPAAEVRFKAINEAYEILSDPQKRQHYDRFGSAGPSGAGFGPFAQSDGFTDIFDMFFGGRAQGAQPRSGPARGADLRYDLQITLEDAFRGVEREISFNHLAACEACHGSGAKAGTQVVRCDRCAGTGVMRSVRQTPLGQFVTQSTCSKCGGEGQVVPTPCETCRGRGRVERARSISVKIPPGADDGSRIRIGGGGEAGTRGGTPGDLYVYLTVMPHARFRRDGQNLHLDIPLAFTQAALGAVVSVDGLDGPHELAIAAGTQSGATYRLRGRGMPSVRGGGQGDLLVRVHVLVPTKLSRRERELLEEFARMGGDAVDERSFLERVKDAFSP